MGNSCTREESKDEAKKSPQGFAKIGLNFSLDEWKSYHNEGTVEEKQAELENLGTDLKKSPTIPKCMTKSVFICCNSYTTPKYSLGVGPISDAITVATFMKSIGFKIYFLHNPKSTEFLKFFKSFIQKTTEYLLVYYSGHSTSVGENDRSENDEKDEALVFDDNLLGEVKLIDSIINAGKPPECKSYFVSDCCHSGTIFDFSNINNNKKLPPNIISMTAARNSELNKQTSVGGNDQGIFTFYFFKIISEKDQISPKTMEEEISQYLKRFQQNFVIYSTTDSLLDENIFK